MYHLIFLNMQINTVKIILAVMRKHDIHEHKVHYKSYQTSKWKNKAANAFWQWCWSLNFPDLKERKQLHNKLYECTLQPAAVSPYQTVRVWHLKVFRVFPYNKWCVIFHTVKLFWKENGNFLIFLQKVWKVPVNFKLIHHV